LRRARGGGGLSGRVDGLEISGKRHPGFLHQILQKPRLYGENRFPEHGVWAGRNINAG